MSPADMLLPWNATLGEIAECCLSSSGNGHTSEYGALLPKADQVYGERYLRTEYKIWRVVFGPDELDSFESRKWREKGVFALAQKALQASGLVLWGAIAVLSGALSSDRRTGLFNNGERLKLARQCYELLFGEIPPLPQYKAESGLLKALLLDAAQHVMYDDSGCPMTVADAASYLGLLEVFLKQADPDWLPGYALSSSTLTEEYRRRDFRRGVSPHPFDQVVLTRKTPLYRARNAARLAVSTGEVIDADAEQLLKRGRNYAISAWLEGRSYRVEKCNKLKLRSFSVYDAINVPALWCDELGALECVAQANRDCGRYEDSARACYLLLRLIPDWLVNANQIRDIFPNWSDSLSPQVKKKIGQDALMSRVREFQRKANEIAGVVRQAGLAVDERFALTAEENNARFALPDQDLDEIGRNIAIVHDPAPTEPARTARTFYDPFALRVHLEQQSSDDWKVVLGACPDSKLADEPLFPLRQLASSVKSIKDEQVLRCGFQLSRRYNNLGWAAKFLEAIGPCRELLMDFVHDVKRNSQIMPLGMYDDTHQRWHRIIREHWRALCRQGTPSFADALPVHEILVGRKLAIAGTARGAQSRALMLKRYDKASDDDLRGHHEATATSGDRGLGIVTPKALDGWLRGYRADRGLGAPVCASVVCSEDGARVVSVLFAADGQGLLVLESKSLEDLSGLLAACQRAIDDSRLWACDATKPIYWNHPELRGLVAVARRIFTEGLALQSDACWFMLAVDPQLANIPWQNLFDHVEPNRKGRTVVSLVPNLSWAVFHSRAPEPTSRTGKDSQAKVGIRLVLDDGDPILGGVCKLVRETTNLMCLESASITVGHGKVTADEKLAYITVRGEDLGVGNWWDSGESRLNFIYSCHSGSTPLFLGDFGGVPGIVLQHRTRLVCAPIVEIPVSAIEQFHQCLLASPNANVASRYLSAICVCPQVSLFTLTGLADEPLHIVSS